MRLVVCPLQEVRRLYNLHRPAGVISVLAPEQASPRLGAGASAARLRLAFHDIDQARPALQAPDARAMARLVDFAAALPADATVLIHCWMGISRSPAAAFILACAAAPGTPETAIAAELRRIAPTATPNPMMVRLADAHLGRAGRMSAAISAIGVGAICGVGVPFTLDANAPHG
jgi:predicted protein tyrosine phosphatase